MGTVVEESQTVDVTTGTTHINSSESPVKQVDSPAKEAVEIVVEQTSAPAVVDNIEETSPLGKRIRRASSKYEDVESKTLLVGEMVRLMIQIMTLGLSDFFHQETKFIDPENLFIVLYVRIG